MSFRVWSKTITVIDDKMTGVSAKTTREKAKVGLREMARILKCSPSWIWDLEKGNRRWTGNHAKKYIAWLVEKSPMYYRKGANDAKDNG